MRMPRVFAAFALFAAIAIPTARADEPVALKFAWPAPLKSDSADLAFAWKDRVVQAAGGALTVQVFPEGTIAKTINVLDRVMNGVADIGFGILGPYSRTFPQAFVVQLPFVCNNSAECSTALWRLYADGTIAGEFKDVHPLALFNFTAASQHTTKPVRRMEDLAGMKIALSSKVLSDDVALLGGTPITQTPSDFYESLSRGLVQGVLISWPGAISFKMQEVTRYHMDTPFGLFPAFIIMNKDSYAKLPAKVKQAFDENSGEKFSRIYGAGLDKSNDASVEEFRKMQGHEVVVLPKAELARWEKTLDPIIAEWVKATPDGDKVLKAFRAELAKIRGGA
jgi:TRAP-type C4-dicarboxylate transport system substrate-binding protein